jgi:hypothetical protein
MYVSSIDQGTLIQGMQKVAASASRGRLRLRIVTTESARIYAGTGNLVCISPEQDGWTAAWTDSHRFCSLVFANCRLSGLLLGTDDRRYWQYALWRDGEIADWFVSNPIQYFDQWSTNALSDFVGPYLVKHGVLPEAVESGNIRDTIRTNLSAFRGTYQTLLPYLQSGTSEDCYEAWRIEEPIYALDQSSDVLNILFTGLEYGDEAVALYADFRFGKIPLEQAGDYELENYQRSRDAIPRIDEFALLYFVFPDGEDYKLRYTELDELFYWDW